MPTLDRRIIVRRSVTAANIFGEIETTTTDYPAWTSRIDASFIDAETEGGTRNYATRAYVVRYRSEIADALVSELSIIEGGLTLNVQNMIEGTERGERRRFLRIEAIGQPPA